MLLHQEAYTGHMSCFYCPVLFGRLFAACWCSGLHVGIKVTTSMFESQRQHSSHIRPVYSICRLGAPCGLPGLPSTWHLLGDWIGNILSVELKSLFETSMSVFDSLKVGLMRLKQKVVATWCSFLISSICCLLHTLLSKLSATKTIILKPADVVIIPASFEMWLCCLLVLLVLSYWSLINY